MNYALKRVVDWLRGVSEKLRCLAEDSEDGVWRTVRGRKIFIKKGESLDDALKHDPDRSKRADEEIPTRGSDAMYIEVPSSNAGGGARSAARGSVLNFWKQVGGEADGGAARLKAGFGRMSDSQLESAASVFKGLVGAGKYAKFVKASHAAIRDEWNTRVLAGKRLKVKGAS